MRSFYGVDCSGGHLLKSLYLWFRLHCSTCSLCLPDCFWDPERVMISVVAYMLLGLAGLPIFSEGGGIWYSFKPSFGYIIGFCLGTFVTGLIAVRLKQKTVFSLFTCKSAGLMIVYICGMVYYYVICNYVIDTPIGIWPMILYCFLLAVPAILHKYPGSCHCKACQTGSASISF